MKIVEFWDLAGDIKYMKTTVYGLTSSAPDVVMVVISGNKGVGGTTLEQLQIAKALKLPIFVVLTKTDLCSPSQIESECVLKLIFTHVIENMIFNISYIFRTNTINRKIFIGPAFQLFAYCDQLGIESRKRFQNFFKNRKSSTNFYDLICDWSRP